MMFYVSILCDFKISGYFNMPYGIDDLERSFLLPKTKVKACIYFQSFFLGFSSQNFTSFFLTV